MPGVPASFTYDSADILEAYDTHEACWVLIWLPADWATRHRISLCAGSYGGGWVSSDHQYNIGARRNQLVAGLNVELATLFLLSGWAYAHVLWPMGWQNRLLQYYPATRHPQIQRYMGRAIQHLKTRAAAQRDADNITGDADHSLAIDTAQYVAHGVSSSSDNWGYCMYLPSGALPYYPEGASVGRYDIRYQRRFDHRVAAAILVDLFTDFRWLDPALQSSNMVPLFGSPERLTGSPKITGVELEALRDASVLPQVERDELYNRDLALCTFSPGTAGTGNILGNPALTADDWRTLAAPRTPITGCGDVHEVGTAISLEDALKEIEQRRGVPWESTKHRILWGNETNNPNGRPAIGTGVLGPHANFAEYAHDWVVNTLQIPASL